MSDFFMVSTRTTKRGSLEIYPRFLIKKSTELMIRGGDFYAIWLEDQQRWSTDENDALRVIDQELDAFAKRGAETFDGSVKVLHMWDAESGMIDVWHKYCQRQLRDDFRMLDETLIFSNHECVKNDYASKKLSYPLEPCDISAYERLISTLYNEEERHKIEWAIGSIVTGDSKTIQKFMVLYGSAGTGKSTVLNIIQMLFDGYYSVFDAKALGSTSNAFALEAFRTNPLVAIQHDGDLSRIEDNTRLNSLVSHELMTVNEKFKSTYATRFKAFLFMGTNKPVKITDAKSGLIRRLIDVTPSGNKLSPNEYKRCIGRIPFELGGIACHCRDVYLENPAAYDDYIPVNMMGATNDFYNYIVETYHLFKDDDAISLKAAWDLYKAYCEDAKVGYPLSKRVFSEELKNYFKEFRDRYTLPDGTRVRSYFSGFRIEKFDRKEKSEKQNENDTEEHNWIRLDEGVSSEFDRYCVDCFAQYASDDEHPLRKWENVTSVLGELDTSRLHYVRLPINHIVIDFDIRDQNTGDKSLDINLKEASKWPPTYAEVSKGGNGLHLHYIYTGDPEKLSRIYDDKIEVKVFTGKSSLRRKLTKCNNLQIANISSGLPTKGDTKMIDNRQIRSERVLRTLIKRNLNKEIHPGTKPSVDFIYKILEDAYNSDLAYDVSDMRQAILNFAISSTHHADYCMKLLGQMKFKSDNEGAYKEANNDILTFYDIEVFPNLLLVCYKQAGEEKPIIRLFNPGRDELERLFQYNLVDFNGLAYDRIILYARGVLGYSIDQCYELSQALITNKIASWNPMFRESKNIGYADVFDFCSKRQSLKKWEIELGIHHQELGLPWDKPAPEQLWETIADYCENDVRATEAVFNARQGDFIARKILAVLAGGTVNDKTNTLSQRLCFGDERNPQVDFEYRDLGDISQIDESSPVPKHLQDDFTKFDKNRRPIFPGYEYKFGKSTYRDEEVGEGGEVWARPGMYGKAKTFDVSSMHPSTIIADRFFGKWTKNFETLKKIRVEIKHKNLEHAKELTKELLVRLHGAEKANEAFNKVAEYYTEENAKLLANAFKLVINSVYGQTAAHYQNRFADPRNVDNYVAKRGALFMVNLRHAVQNRGYTVIHIKTDSIKILNPDEYIQNFVYEYGKLYGYDFEIEHSFDRICLVNDAVYIARLAEDDPEEPGSWTATGKEFAVPYTFKTCFSHEAVVFEDMCETFSVQGALYLDMNEGYPDTTKWDKVQLLRKRKSDGERLSKANQLYLEGYSGYSDEDIETEIQKGHDYHFVGKVGQFTPIKPGCGGGILLREADSKYSAASGSKKDPGYLKDGEEPVYRWMESEMVRRLGKEGDIDKTFYRVLVDKAIKKISEFGDYEMFVSGDPIPESFPLDEDELPF